MRIIAFTGKKGHGKNTAADALLDAGFHAIDFADPLRDVVHLVYGVSHEEMADPVLKEMPLDRWPFVSPRFLLQKVGTEMFRNVGFDETWVMNHRMRVAYDRRCRKSNGIVVRDLRFLNEEKYLRTMAGVMIVRVENPRIEAKTDGHVSETEMEKIVPDMTICNDGAVHDLHDAVKRAFL